ncbi:ATP-binding protein [Egbenema bharatensis]|uniref:ATP-binding protein n=1 Tax=Egbenema bharatensis TaxID=3463334 RepID=UPI003A89442F
MMLDLHKFFQVTNPAKTLVVERGEDRKYYIDFSSVRGETTVETIRDNISLFYPDQETYDLFTGHIGCGKSTELLRLKAELQQQGFHVIYFESDQDLEMGDIDVSDILLTIAYRVSQSLEEAGLILQPRYVQSLLKELQEFLQSVEISAVSCPFGIAEITTRSKFNPKLRDRLRGYLEPRTNQIIESINRELLEPAIEKLRHLNQRGLVVIIDNLDRIDFSPKPWGRPQPEYLFIDRATQLRSLHCHVVYTIPLALLRFSDDYKVISERFVADPLVLPMVPIRWRDGKTHEAGMSKLRQMVLARAFPDLDEAERLQKITEVFDTPETLDRLCQASGGHVRNLLRFLNKWIKAERRLPLCRDRLEMIIRDELNQAMLGIVKEDWALLRQIAQEKKGISVNDEQRLRYQKLLRNLLVLEYRDQDGAWFDVNPILAEAEGMK